MAILIGQQNLHDHYEVSFQKESPPPPPASPFPPLPSLPDLGRVDITIFKVQTYVVWMLASLIELLRFIWEYDAQQ